MSNLAGCNNIYVLLILFFLSKEWFPVYLGEKYPGHDAGFIP